MNAAPDDTARGDGVARPALAHLARTLGAPGDPLEFLAEVPDPDLREFRVRIADELRRDSGEVIAALASASSILPTGLMAKVARRTGNPVFVACLAAAIEPARAAKVAAGLPPAFLAEVAAELEPRDAGAIVGRLPARVLAEVARELARRQDWVSLGGLVGELPEAAVRAAIAELSDRALIGAAAMVESGQDLATVIGAAPVARVPGLLAAVAEADLWDEFDALAPHLPAEHRAVAERAARELGEAVAGRFHAAVAAGAPAGVPESDE
ncbi:hypothetical protein IU433_06490 [Nocardia puris]|uniref:Uncharacterized protein n=1 Tax=Nocardia puris TaxID=208602 RepID=A0A366DEF8_9NOCA|nr:hypothetical protein [Nocardia puris]MBF6211182.1 hypothetical protein [Nocardia puris]MBF6364901.1 hypothetical protein [Nocardia puris]MBF6458687.1 hypothetical protein [Nocardia puris]RBO87814.1 hypothetical protein DFR74_11068 [Nocardia puris]